MPTDKSHRTKLPFRNATRPTQKQDAKKPKSSTHKAALPTSDLGTFVYVEAHPNGAAAYYEDTADWVVVQADSSPPSNSSDDTQIYGPGQELTTTNIQLLDNINNSPASSCGAELGGQRRRCRRRCPKCRYGSVKTRMSAATHHSPSHGAKHMDPWAPISVDSYESDTFAVGAWAEAYAATAYTYAAGDIAM